MMLLILPSLCLASKPNPPWEEVIAPNGSILMYRMPVPRGWLVYNYVTSFGGGISTPTTTFVPDEYHEWILETH